MSNPEDESDEKAADEHASREVRSAPGGKGDSTAVDEPQHGNEQDNSEDQEQSSDHDIHHAMTDSQGEGLAVLSVILGEKVRMLRTVRDPETLRRAGELVGAVLEAPVRSHVDLLALTALTRAALTSASTPPVPGEREITPSEAATIALLFLDKAIQALEWDTGYSTEGFTGQVDARN